MNLSVRLGTKWLSHGTRREEFVCLYTRMLRVLHGIHVNVQPYLNAPRVRPRAPRAQRTNTTFNKRRTADVHARE